MYTWEKVSPLISCGSTVVEIGVGPISAITKQLKNVRVIGVDLGDDQLPLCDKFNIDLRMCDIQTEPLPLENGSVDMVLFLQVIEHLCMYPNVILDQIYKKLKTGGYLVVSTVNFLRISNRIRTLLGLTPLKNCFEPSEDGRNHIREYVLSELLYYLKKSGFNIEETDRFALPAGSVIISTLLRFMYIYPSFRNYFMIIAKK